MTANRDLPAPVLNEDLRTHGAFLRRLARGLVRDEHDCEDVLQGSLVAALRAPDSRPATSSGARAWWATIVRNAARRLHRDRLRREEHEAASARDRPLAGHAGPDVERQLELQEEVLRAVRGLREPYRTAIHLRYFADLAPREIAKRLGVPSSTVDTRIVRGRELLRERLTQAHDGDREVWLAGLVPLLRPSDLAPVVSATTAGAWIVGTKLKVLLAAGAAAAVAVVAWPTAGSSDGARAQPSAHAAPPAVTELSAPTRPLAQVAQEPDRAPAPAEVAETTTEEPASAEETPASAMGTLVTGLVVDDSGTRLPAVRVAFDPDGSTTEPNMPPAERLATATDGSGAFEFVVQGGGEIYTDELDLVTVLAGSTEGRGPTKTVVVAARVRELSIDVVDSNGTPLADVAVSGTVPEDFRRRFALDLERSSDVRFRSTTNIDGQARIQRVPEVAGFVLTARSDSHAEATLTLGEREYGSADPVYARFVLEHLAGESTTLTGSVIDRDGLGVEGAEVTYGALATTTDVDGRFFFDLAEGGGGGAMLEDNERHDLVAVRTGFLPARLRPELDAVSGMPLWPDEIVLQPVDPPLSIAGRVIDEDGTPLANWVVFLPRTRLFDGRTVEATIAGETGFFYSVRTDAGGNFELPALLDQDYDIAAIDPDTLRRVDAADVLAGTDDLELRASNKGIWRVLSGRIVDARGNPQAGVEVAPYALTQSATGAQGYWTSSMDLTPAVTADDGCFEFHELPKDATLSLTGSTIIHDTAEGFASEAQIDDDEFVDLVGVEVEVVLRLRFQVLLDDPEEASEFRILDESGSEMYLHAQTATSYLIRADHSELTEGRSRHLFVEEGAATIVLVKDGVDVRSVPIALEPGEETQLRL